MKKLKIKKSYKNKDKRPIRAWTLATRLEHRGIKGSKKKSKAKITKI